MVPDDETQGGQEDAGDASASAKQPEAEAKPADDTKPAEDATPAAETKPENDAKPAAGAKLEAEAKPENDAKPPEDEDPARPVPPPGGIADLLAEALPDVEMTAYQGMTDVIVEIARDDVSQVMKTAREDPRLDLSFLRCLSGVDYQDEGLEVVYHLLSLEKKHEVVIKTRLANDDAKVASVAAIWHAADWHEREARDMFGITFDGHPNLVPLLLPEDMTDHYPLRKDNPLAEIEEWQGDQLPEEGAGGSKTR